MSAQILRFGQALHDLVADSRILRAVRQIDQCAVERRFRLGIFTFAECGEAGIGSLEGIGFGSLTAEFFLLGGFFGEFLQFLGIKFFSRFGCLGPAGGDHGAGRSKFRHGGVIVIAIIRSGKVIRGSNRRFIKAGKIVRRFCDRLSSRRLTEQVAQEVVSSSGGSFDNIGRQFFFRKRSRFISKQVGAAVQIIGGDFFGLNRRLGSLICKWIRFGHGLFGGRGKFIGHLCHWSLADELIGNGFGFLSRSFRNRHIGGGIGHACGGGVRITQKGIQIEPIVLGQCHTAKQESYCHCRNHAPFHLELLLGIETRAMIRPNIIQPLPV